ncbi:FAST kinase domain-containing protein 3, mitochondrial isoform X4 [Choloepus didactylus]|uniref:FAST kinase domain-containing protein 3, mitochondrial isoform X4 n=1 Tax=Choloepus didactylus TaxID=27675 RepID=UPI00189FC720|nr:FAST kinase domain-containing protein 3, mitochondrial isoform X4 [Choloepus didactylus]
MALITLRRNLCHLPDFRIHGAVAALKNQPVNHVHKAAKAHLCPLLFSQQSSPFRVRFHHSCCKKFHSENGNDLHPVGEPMFSQVHDWDRQGENTENVDEERFYRRLSSFTSSAEVLGFISTLATLPDAVAARALQWICEMEKKDGNSRLPKEILENNIFKALCFRFEQEPSRLSNTDIVTALQALSLLHVDPQSGLLVSLVAECQSRLRKGGLEVHNLCILGESLIKLQGPGCTTLEVILCQLQGEETYLDRLNLAQLTQLYLTSVLECPFYKGPKLLPKYQVKSFLTPCCSLETPVDFHLYKSVMIGLIDLLGARLYFASKVLTPYCYTIDVEIKLDEEGFVLPLTVNEDVHKRIALCIDGPKRFCFNSKNLLGKEAVKQRHLRLLGYQVVQIPYHEVEMLKSRPELVEYLQRKLFSQNDEVQR